ncbi:MAG: hypothetical protein CSA34_02180 [Desulfobulbus propionicus]|nr:MAG: hypothetical protein CSA34_02180 [Desulfobulbus propionicus]
MRKKLDIRRKINYLALRFKRLRGSPRSLALGAALGAAIGVTPTLPFHTVLIIGTTMVFRVSTIAGIIAATIVSNPFTFALHYYAAWWLGDLIFPHRLTWKKLEGLLNQLRSDGLIHAWQTISSLGVDTLLVMTTGGLLLALPFGLLFYIFGLRFFESLQKKRLKKQQG